MSLISLVAGYIGAVMASPNSLIAGMSTSELRIPPAAMVSAMRVPMMYPTPSSSGPTSSEMLPPS